MAIHGHGESEENLIFMGEHAVALRRATAFCCVYASKVTATRSYSHPSIKINLFLPTI